MRMTIGVENVRSKSRMLINERRRAKRDKIFNGIRSRRDQHLANEEWIIDQQHLFCDFDDSASDDSSYDQHIGDQHFDSDLQRLAASLFDSFFSKKEKFRVLDRIYETLSECVRIAEELGDSEDDDKRISEIRTLIERSGVIKVMVEVVIKGSFEFCMQAFRIIDVLLQTECHQLQELVLCSDFGLALNYKFEEIKSFCRTRIAVNNVKRLNIVRIPYTEQQLSFLQVLANSAASFCNHSGNNSLRFALINKMLSVADKKVIVCGYFSLTSFFEIMTGRVNCGSDEELNQLVDLVLRAFLLTISNCDQSNSGMVMTMINQLQQIPESNMMISRYFQARSYLISDLLTKARSKSFCSQPAEMILLIGKLLVDVALPNLLIEALDCNFIDLLIEVGCDDFILEKRPLWDILKRLVTMISQLPDEVTRQTMWSGVDLSEINRVTCRNVNTAEMIVLSLSTISTIFNNARTATDEVVEILPEHNQFQFHFVNKQFAQLNVPQYVF